MKNALTNHIKGIQALVPASLTTFLLICILKRCSLYLSNKRTRSERIRLKQYYEVSNTRRRLLF